MRLLLLCAALLAAGCAAPPNPQRVPTWAKLTQGTVHDETTGLPNAVIDRDSGIEMVLILAGTYGTGDGWYGVEVAAAFYVTRDITLLRGTPPWSDGRDAGGGLRYLTHAEGVACASIFRDMKCEMRCGCNQCSGLFISNRLVRDP